MAIINEARLLSKIAPLNSILETRFGLTIGVTPVEHLTEVRDHYRAKRESYLKTLGEAKALECPAYAKAVLISEATHMLLREIAPKRMKRKTKRKS